MKPPLGAALEALRDGEIVCIPTETTYGLAVDVRRPEALAALARLKGRPESAPFGLVASDLAQARELAAVWPREADRLARRHWPGALTLVVPARDELPAEIVGPSGGVGVRVAAHPWPVELARRLGAAITATSANPAGEPPALDVDRARAYFGDGVAVYLDDGPAARQDASTLIEVTADERCRLLRPGQVVVKGLDG